MTMDDLTKRELAIIAAGIITTVVLATVLSWLLVYAFLPSDPRDPPLTKAGGLAPTQDIRKVK
jgi:hypothetical protein